jgi:hypothetical protein
MTTLELLNNCPYFSIAVSLFVMFVVTFSASSFAQDPDLQNIASNILENKTMILPESVKNFIILIPNEAHESPLLPKDQRLINQPYVPQNLVAPRGTSIVWFTGDVGHTRKVTLTDENSKEIFNSVLKFNSASKPLFLNQSGKFNYFEYDANSQDPDFVMNGTITIKDPDSRSNNTSNTDLISSYDKMSVIMVPTKDIKKHSEILDENNVSILDQYSFKDFREVGGGGANQTLLILGSDIPMDETTSVLKKITSSLPYS